MVLAACQSIQPLNIEDGICPSVVRCLLMRRAFIRKRQCKERKLKEDFRFAVLRMDRTCNSRRRRWLRLHRKRAREIALPSSLSFFRVTVTKVHFGVASLPSSLPPHASATSAFSICGRINLWLPALRQRLVRCPTPPYCRGRSFFPHALTHSLTQSASHLPFPFLVDRLCLGGRHRRILMTYIPYGMA